MTAVQMTKPPKIALWFPFVLSFAQGQKRIAPVEYTTRLGTISTVESR